MNNYSQRMACVSPVLFKALRYSGLLHLERFMACMRWVPRPGFACKLHSNSQTYTEGEDQGEAVGTGVVNHTKSTKT